MKFSRLFLASTLAIALGHGAAYAAANPPLRAPSVSKGKRSVQHAKWLFVMVCSGDDWKIAADTWTIAD